MYYLICNQDGTFKPLPLKTLPFFANKKATNIINLVNFTMQFSNISELKTYLEQQGIKNLASAKIYYAIGKGTKENKTYRLINFNEHLYFKECHAFFLPHNLVEYILDHQFDLDFISQLYAQYLKNNNGLNYIIKKIHYFYFHRPELYQKYLTILERSISNPTTKSIISGLLNLNDNEAYQLNTLTNRLKDILQSSSYDLISFYHVLGSMNNIPELNCLKRMANMARYVANIGLENYENLKDENHEAAQSNIYEFIRLCCYVYDSNLKNYRQKNGKFIENPRGIFDLATFILDYEGYQEVEEKTVDEEYEDDDEEFLEAEDYWRMGLDPEENGLRLKGDKWKH